MAPPVQPGSIAGTGDFDPRTARACPYWVARRSHPDSTCVFCLLPLRRSATLGVDFQGRRFARWRPEAGPLDIVAFDVLRDSARVLGVKVRVERDVSWDGPDSTVLVVEQMNAFELGLSPRTLGGVA